MGVAKIGLREALIFDNNAVWQLISRPPTLLEPCNNGLDLADHDTQQVNKVHIQHVEPSDDPDIQQPDRSLDPEFVVPDIAVESYVPLAPSCVSTAESALRSEVCVTSQDQEYSESSDSASDEDEPLFCNADGLLPSCVLNDFFT